LFGDRRVLLDQERQLLGEIRKKMHKAMSEATDLEIEKMFLKGLRCENYEEIKTFSDDNLCGSFSDKNGLFDEELQELKKVEERKKTNEWNNSFSYDFAQPDLIILWRKQIYFVQEWLYTDNYKLYGVYHNKRVKSVKYIYNG
jgi:hypothetical protein